MLLGQQGRRHQYRHLPSAHDGDKRRPQRDLGLAETDIAAHQAVHRPAGLHVVDDSFDRRQLVGRFLEREAFGEGFVIMQAKRECMTLARSAHGVQIEQFGRGVVDLLEGAAFGLVPLSAAQPVQRGRLGRAAGIAGNHEQLRYRHVQLVGTGIFQQQEFGLAFAEIQIHQPPITADPMLLMDHRVVLAQLRQVAQHALGTARTVFFTPAFLAYLGRIKFGFGDQRKGCGGHETVVQWRHHQHQGLV
ncbi:hypothetical protein GALL_438920 [mine drainage metagenome]|uniref:Uncharacterized protein n=1 Tax=mine drainage metagenome TaxID=410659 RepID=A0A1J5PS80_9ZZZZ